MEIQLYNSTAQTYLFKGYGDSSTYGNFYVYFNYTVSGTTLSNMSIKLSKDINYQYTTNSAFIDGLTLNGAAMTVSPTSAGLSSYNTQGAGPTFNVSGTYTATGSSVSVVLSMHRSGQGGSAQVFSGTVTGLFVYPWWVRYDIHSLPGTAYANMPYSYNVSLECNYGSSTSNNLLYWDGYRNDDNHYIAMGGAAAGATTYSGIHTCTFTTNDIGTYTTRGVIQYTDPNGNRAWNINPTAYPLTISWLDPTLSGVTHTLNKTTFFRTSTVTSTTSATMNSNSAAPNIYVYFSDTTDATGDSGAGYYLLSQNQSISGVTKSYTHSGTNSGTFSSQIVLNGNNQNGDWVNFANYNSVSYTMQPFVAPTCTRTVTYTRHNVYEGQKVYPVKVVVSSKSKSPYDPETPYGQMRISFNNLVLSNFSAGHSWEPGTYTHTFNNTALEASDGDKVSFPDHFYYKNVDNNTVYTSVSTQVYNTIPIPTPTSAQITVGLSITRTQKMLSSSITGSFDSDFVCKFTMYLESTDGSYSKVVTSDDYLEPNHYIEMGTYYDDSITRTYRTRVDCVFVLADDYTVSGKTTATFYSEPIQIIGGSNLSVKSGNITNNFYFADASTCPVPRLGVKYGNTVGYLPLYKKMPDNIFTGYVPASGITMADDGWITLNISSTTTDRKDFYFYADGEANIGQQYNVFFEIGDYDIENMNTHVFLHYINAHIGSASTLIAYDDDTKEFSLARTSISRPIYYQEQKGNLFNFHIEAMRADYQYLTGSFFRFWYNPGHIKMKYRIYITDDLTITVDNYRYPAKAANEARLYVKNGNTIYYTLANTYNGSETGTNQTHEQLSALTHAELSDYTHGQIKEGEVA